MSETIQQGTGQSEGQTIKFETAIYPSLDAHCDPPIHRLPPEILEVVCNYVQRATTIRDLVRLTLVCKRWSNIVQDAPSLWTTINTAEGPLAVRKAMQTAKDALLDLTFDSNTAQMDQDAFLKSIGEQFGQWRTLFVRLDAPEWDLVFEELQKRTPLNLEALRLSARSMTGLSSDTLAVSVFGRNSAPPRLKEILMANIPIDLASLQLSGLKSLIINNIPGASGLDIINVIRGSPAIEFICLESLTGTPPLHEAFSHPGGDPSIQLASLLHLDLYYIAMPFLTFLLSAIAAPLLETLNIHCPLSSVSDAQILLEGLGQQLSTLARLTTDAQYFDFVLSSVGIYRVDIGGLRLRLWTEALPINALEETWDWVFNHLGKPLKDLPAHLFVDEWAPEIIPALMEWLTQRLNVTNLSIATDPDSGRVALDPIIPLFSRPTTSTPATWLFPQVEILATNLVKKNGNDDLVEMIKNRHSAEDGKDGVAAPKRFREIRLEYGGKLGVDSPDPMSMEFLRMVQEVAGGADVYWEKKKLERGRE